MALRPFAGESQLAVYERPLQLQLETLLATIASGIGRQLAQLGSA